MSRLALLNQLSELCFRMNPSWTRTSSDKELEQYLVDGIKETERELQETKALLLLAQAELAKAHEYGYQYRQERNRAEAELAALKSAPVVIPEPVGFTTWGMIECIKALPFTGRIGVRAEKTARWNIPLYTDPVYAKQVIDHGCSYGE